MSTFTDFGRGVLTQVANNGLRKVAGNAPGLLGLSKGGVSRSPQAKLNNFSSKHSTQHLQFPLDVISDIGLGNHGHYIMFYVNAVELSYTFIYPLGKVKAEHSIKRSFFKFSMG